MQKLKALLRRVRPSPLVARFALYVIVFSSAIAVVITGAEMGYEYRRDIEHIDSRMDQIRDAYLESVVENLWVNDVQRLETLLQGITRLPDFVHAEVRVDNQSTLRSGTPLAGRGITQTFELRRMHQGKELLIGELVVQATYQNALHRVLRHLLRFTAANAIKTALVAAFIFYAFYRLIGRHLLHIARHALSYQDRRLLPQAPLALNRKLPSRPDELSRLVSALQRMQDDLLTMGEEQRKRATLLERELMERRRIEGRLDLMATVFQHSREAIMITDAQNRIIATNNAFSLLTGYSGDEVLGRNPRMLSAGLTPTDLYRQLWHDLNEHGTWQGEIWDRRKDGRVYPKWLSINTVRDEQARITHYIGIFSDITERKQAEERIYRLAHHDSLTGLSNRMSLTLELSHAVLQASRHGHVLTVMLIDLDNFKEINDVHGHAIGDQLLQQVAQRLQQAVRHGDKVARLGGDEFVILLSQVSGRDAAGQVAEKIRLALDAPFTVDHLKLRTTASIGLSCFPDDGDTSELLLKRADTAMYHAKSQGRNQTCFYADGMEALLLERVHLIAELRKALDLGQFELHYQPQFSALTGELLGVEALLRWCHPEQGWIPPGKFIPVAEQSGLILPLGEWVLDEACRQWRAWQDTLGGPDLRIAVNLSAQQLASSELTGTVAKLLEWHGVPADRLELEITESMLMEDTKTSTTRLRALRDMGVRLSIDDFGTGYSSLSYLRELPLHGLKLDRSFVQGVETDQGSAAICQSIIVLAHNLGLEVVAEGVETPAQQAFLQKHGCDLLQGYLLARPMPPAQLAEDVENGRFSRPALAS
ncbi:bifunctional diguanylate cyclase/phosphodiesterase [Hydrogenophaga aquatica]